MGAKLGCKAKAYYLSSGTRATWGTADANGLHSGAAPASLNEITNTQDVTLGLTKGEADGTARGSGWEEVLATFKAGSVSFKLRYDPTDAAYLAIMKAWLGGGSVAMVFLDGDKATVGSIGLWADFEILSVEKSENLREAQVINVSMKPSAASSVAPEMVIVAAS